MGNEFRSSVSAFVKKVVTKVKTYFKKAVVVLSSAAIAVGAFFTELGFTISGVAAGSVAAAIQSSIGNVALGSSFAVLTGLGASGVLVGLMTAGVIGLGVYAAVKYLLKW